MSTFVPQISKPLIKFLDEAFPDSLKLALRPDWNLDKAAGAREVIDLLKAHLIVQQESEEDY